jgi:ubiquinol-cytochrome c reductase iron-sulfur subunit
MTVAHTDTDSAGRPGLHVPPASADFDVDDETLTRFQLVREGARRDGVEIVHYEPRFPIRGTKLEKRVERSIALLLVLSGLFGIGFFVAFIWWPQQYQPGNVASKYYTPLLGLGLGGSLFLLGLAVIAWAKKLLPAEISVQERHDGRPAHDEQALTGATILNLVDETGIKRRPLLKAAFLLPAAGLGLAAGTALVGGLIKDPNHPAIFLSTGWSPANNNGQPVRLVREDGTPIRPEDVSAGGQMTVFPGIPGGATNQYASSPTLLIHLYAQDAAALRASIATSLATNNEPQPIVSGLWENYVAYSKICTHAGCPASLYERQDNRLLCPCHQSQFLITEQARPVFGPATRRLPMLPLDVQDGYLVAKSDYLEPVGPAYWERP